MTNIDWNTFEQDTGLKWVDGKAIFQKTIEMASLPNGPVLDTKLVPHNIAGIDTVIDVYGSAGPSSGVLIGLPQFDNNSVGNVDVFADVDDIEYSTSQNFSAFTVSQVTITYTKT